MDAEQSFAWILACNRHREGLQLGAEGCAQTAQSYQTPQIAQGEVFSSQRANFRSPQVSLLGLGLLQDRAFRAGILQRSQTPVI